jgi:hypothetical protein
LEARILNKEFTKESPHDYSIPKTPVDAHFLKKDGQFSTLFSQDDIPLIEQRQIFPFFSEDKTYKMLLIPVGNPDSITLGSVRNILRSSFKELPIEFSYLRISIPVEVKLLNHYGIVPLEQGKSLLENVQSVAPVDGIAFVVNSTTYFGSGGNYPVFSGSHKYTSYLAAHELGHHFGLNDGYEGTSSKINGTELFTHVSRLPSLVKNAYRKSRPPIYFTGNHHDGDGVYQFYEKSIMRDSAKSYSEEIRQGKDVFNALQLHIMRSTIKSKLKKH